MSGNGAPVNTDLTRDPPLVPPEVPSSNPVPQCFYYKYWYDFVADRFYSLEKDLNGKNAGYTVLEDGLDVLNADFRITSAGNIGAQGTVLSSATLLGLQACLNARAAAGNSFAMAGSGNAVCKNSTVPLMRPIRARLALFLWTLLHLPKHWHFWRRMRDTLQRPIMC